MGKGGGKGGSKGGVGGGGGGDAGGGGGGGGGGEGGGGKGGGGGNKPAEIQPHPVKEQLPDVQYCVNSPPPWPAAIALGFQHYLLSLGMNVLIPSIIVPQMGGNTNDKAMVIQRLVFASGINTILQSLFGCRLPSIAVGSYAYIIPMTSIIHSYTFTRYADPRERFVNTMRGLQGALIASSFLTIALGFLGLWRNFGRLLSPLSAAALVTFTGLGLYQHGFAMLANCIEYGLPALIILVFTSQYLPQLVKSKQGLFDRYAFLFTTAVIWPFAAILSSAHVYENKPVNDYIPCGTSSAGLISAAPWIYFPVPFHWGNPTFNAGHIFAMMAASFVALVESTGAFIATSRYGSATPIPPSVLSRGAGWLGVGTLLNGGFGALTGATISVENVGLLGLTKAASRRVVQISGGFMILFSLLGKFGAVFASIPLPIVAAMNCICFAYVSSAGLGLLQFCNLNSFRTKFILGFSLFMGFSVPQYFKEYSPTHHPVHTQARWFNDMVNVIFMSHALVAVLVAIVLDCTLARKHEATRKDQGSHWWDKFKMYSSDGRSAEFYALPWKLNKLFPSL